MSRLFADCAAGYMLMSNLYANAQRWDEVDKIQELKQGSSAWKKPGKASLEVMNKIHEFIVGDEQSVEIASKLVRLKKQVEIDGYVPIVDLILESI